LFPEFTEMENNTLTDPSIPERHGAAKKLNCWEFKKCGLGPDGSRINEIGACPVASNKRFDGMNDGKNAGRTCWAIRDTFCDGKVPNILFLKIKTCLTCDFYRLVRKEEGKEFRGIDLVLDKKWFS
jgi:hypothetical protein